jgi:hypothetical protein
MFKTQTRNYIKNTKKKKTEYKDGYCGSSAKGKETRA